MKILPYREETSKLDLAGVELDDTDFSLVVREKIVTATGSNVTKCERLIPFAGCHCARFVFPSDPTHVTIKGRHYLFVGTGLPHIDWSRVSDLRGDAYLLGKRIEYTPGLSPCVYEGNAMHCDEGNGAFGSRPCTCPLNVPGWAQVFVGPDGQHHRIPFPRACCTSSGCRCGVCDNILSAWAVVCAHPCKTRYGVSKLTDQLSLGVTIVCHPDEDYELPLRAKTCSILLPSPVYDQHLYDALTSNTVRNFQLELTALGMDTSGMLFVEEKRAVPLIDLEGLKSGVRQTPIHH